MNNRRIATRGRPRAAIGLRLLGHSRSSAAPLFLWESLVLGVFGAVASVVVGWMAAGVLNSANIHLPLSMQLFLMSDGFGVSVVPSTLAGAIALITAVLAAHALAHRAFRLRT